MDEMIKPNTIKYGTLTFINIKMSRTVKPATDEP